MAPMRNVYKLVFSLSILTYFSFPVQAIAEENINAGIINGVWFSKLPFFRGDDVVIYTAFQNQSDKELNGVIEFVHNEFVIGEKPFSAKQGEFITRSMDWTATYGDHTFKIRIKDLTARGVNGEEVKVSTQDGDAQSRAFFGDNDTDHDQTGDQVDTDDDNDGLSDNEEKIRGTDPKKKDTDGDGINDKDDANPLSADESKPKNIFTDKGLQNEAVEAAKNVVAEADVAKDDFAQFAEEKVRNIREELKTLEEQPEQNGKGRATSITAQNTDKKKPLLSLANQKLIKKIELGFWTLILTMIKNDAIFYSVLSILTLLFIRLLWKRRRR